jgi:hypothetical protein
MPLEAKILFLSSAISFCFNLFLGIFVLYKKPNSRVFQLFFLFICSLILWIFGDFFYFIPLINKLPIIVGVRFAYIGAVFTITIFGIKVIYTSTY